MAWERYAVYILPKPGPLAEFGAAWLGWDVAAGAACPHPAIAGLPRPVGALTATPRRYGFHGTAKAPFRLADGTTEDELARAVEALAASHAPVRLEGLALARLGRFLALRPEGDGTGLAALAAAAVEGLDRFRAPASWAELAKRRAAGLSRRQEELLQRWGYPYTHDQFHFHITLTGRLAPPELDRVEAALTPVLEPLLPRPFVIDDLALLGSDRDGRFHLIARFPLRA